MTVVGIDSQELVKTHHSPAGDNWNAEFLNARYHQQDVRQAECIVEFTVGEESSVGGDNRPAKLEHKPAVEVDPESAIVGLTGGVRNDRDLRATGSH